MSLAPFFFKDRSAVAFPTESLGSIAMPGLGDRPFFFLHVPKTAGTSLRDLVGLRFHSKNITSIGLDASPESFKSLHQAGPGHFIHGHLPFETIGLSAQRPFIFTLLRDPVDRAISAFQFMKQQCPSIEKLAREGKISAERANDYVRARDLTLSDFLRIAPRAANRHLGNLQVELLTCTDLAKRHRYDENYEIAVTEKDLHLAMDRLKTFDAFGLVESIPKSMEYLAHALGTRPFGEMAWSNKTRVRPKIEEIDEGTLALLRDLTSYDGRLHAFAIELFKQRSGTMRQELSKKLAHQSGDGSRQNLPSVFTSGMPLPGEGWHLAETDNGQWFNWSGPSRESWIKLGSPRGKKFALRIGILHVLKAESLHKLEVLLNGQSLVIKIRPATVGHSLSAEIPSTLLHTAGRENLVTLRVPYVSRPCDLDPLNPDSRTLGIAIRSIEIMAVP